MRGTFHHLNKNSINTKKYFCHTYQKEGCPDQSSNALKDDVKNASNKSNFTSDQKSNSNCWIDVAARDMSNALDSPKMIFVNL